MTFERQMHYLATITKNTNDKHDKLSYMIREIKTRYVAQYAWNLDLSHGTKENACFNDGDTDGNKNKIKSTIPHTHPLIN